MSQQIINVGAAANDGTGDTLRAAGQKINSNFTEVYVTSQLAFNKANTANVTAQAAFDFANTIISDTQIDPYARVTANASFQQANASFVQANTANVTAQAAFDFANTSTQTGDLQARENAQAAFNRANVSLIFAQATSNTANAAFDGANSANVLAQAAFDAANNSPSTNNPTFNVLNIGNNAGINFDGGTGSLYWAGQSGVVQVTDNKAGAYRSINSANNSLFTFAANGSGTMSVSVEGSMFVGTANPPNDGGITTAYPGWLVVQNGAKFGAGIDILGDVGVGSVLKIEDGTHEKYQTISDANGVVTHDCSSGYIFYHNSPDNNWTANLINLNTSVDYATAITLVINQGANGYYANTLFVNGSPQTINWQGNTTPIVSNNRVDVQTFSILTTNSGYIVLGQLTGF